MKKFLHAALYITWFQVFVILFFSALKYVLIKYHIEDKIQQPFIWACFGAGIVYVIAWSVIGTIENKGVS